MDKHEFINDIPMSCGVNAHRGLSFSPERRGEQEREGYAETMAADFASLARWADTDEKKSQLVEEFGRYRAGYRARTIAQLSSKSRCVSTMIAGPSNFNVRRAEKANRAERSRLEDLIGFRERALKAIEKVLRPELRPIMSGDANAQEALQAKIEKAEAYQAKIKLVNGAIRKHKKAGPEAQVAALVELGYSEGEAKRLLTPDSCGRIGFPDYEMTNNNANIRRMKERLKTISVNQAKEATEAEGTEAKVEDCPAENRVRLTFPGKPSEEVRTELKSGGFRWTPSLGVWQAYRNYRTMELAKKIAGIHEGQNLSA